MRHAAVAPARTVAATVPSFTRVRRGTLQRCGAGPCTCGCESGADHEHDAREAGATSGAAPAAVQAALASPGQPLDGRTRSSLERRLGHDFGRVRVHTDARAAASARAVHANAYTVGSDVVFGSGQYAPGTGAGRRLLAHELAHVIQQGEAPRHGEAREATSAGSPEREAEASERLAGTGGPPDAGVPETAPADAGARAPDAEAPAEAPAPAPAEAAPEEAPPAAPPPPPLRWDHVKLHRWDALWWFCGERPAGFSTTARLRATGHTDPTALAWTITQGSDKVEFIGTPAGADVDIRSKAGSARLDDVKVEVREGATAVYLGTLTVRKPHRLIQRSVRDFNGCPPAFPACPAACPAHWTEIGYRVVDNVGGTVVGATVNENFPAAKVNDQPNDWVNPASFSSVPVWPNTDGTFIDFWSVWCGTPSPVAPGAAGAATSVDRLRHEFYVGSRVSGRGCRVQTHTAHRYLGHTRHEGITTPAP